MRLVVRAGITSTQGCLCYKLSFVEFRPIPLVFASSEAWIPGIWGLMLFVRSCWIVAKKSVVSTWKLDEDLKVVSGGVW